MEEKHAGGRPTKYTSEMCNTVIARGEEGGSVVELADACDVTVSTLYEWAKTHEEFSEAFTRAQEKAEVFWAKRVKDGLSKTPSEFQGAANLKYMAQRFQDRWSEKNRVELTGANGGAVETITRIELVAPNVNSKA